MFMHLRDVTMTSVLPVCVQVFDQFVKSRVKDEYKEKRSKLQKAREEFKQLLEEAKITSRYSSFIIQWRTQLFSCVPVKSELTWIGWAVY